MNTEQQQNHPHVPPSTPAPSLACNHRHAATTPRANTPSQSHMVSIAARVLQTNMGGGGPAVPAAPGARAGGVLGTLLAVGPRGASGWRSHQPMTFMALSCLQTRGQGEGRQGWERDQEQEKNGRAAGKLAGRPAGERVGARAKEQAQASAALLSSKFRPTRVLATHQAQCRCCCWHREVTVALGTPFRSRAPA